MSGPAVLTGKELDVLMSVLNPIREEQLQALEDETYDTWHIERDYSTVCAAFDEHIVSASDRRGFLHVDTDQSYSESWAFVDSYRVLEPYGDYYIALRVTTEEHLISHPDERGFFHTGGVQHLRYWLEVLTESPYKTNEFDVVYRMFVSGMNAHPNNRGFLISDGWLKYDNKPVFIDNICPVIMGDKAK